VSHPAARNDSWPLNPLPPGANSTSPSALGHGPAAGGQGGRLLQPMLEERSSRLGGHSGRLYSTAFLLRRRVPRPLQRRGRHQSSRRVQRRRPPARRPLLQGRTAAASPFDGGSGITSDHKRKECPWRLARCSKANRCPDAPVNSLHMTGRNAASPLPVSPVNNRHHRSPRSPCRTWPRRRCAWPARAYVPPVIWTWKATFQAPSRLSHGTVTAA